MGARNALRNLPKERFLDPRELRGFYDVQDLFDLAQIHHFFLATSFRPKLKQASHHRFGKRGVLLQKLYDTVG